MTFLAAILVLASAFAEESAGTAKAPAEAPAAASATVVSTGTRAIPKVGVKEAKALCKKEGEKGRALSSCIQKKVNAP